MNVEKALNILGLQFPTTLEEVEVKYQQLAKNNHPDKGGDNEKMQELNVARDIIKASINNQALIPVSAIQDLIKNSNSEIIQRQEIRDELNDLTNQMKQESQNQLKLFRNLSILVTGIAFLLIFAGKEIFPSHFTWFFLFVGGILGCIAWLFNEQIRRVENRIEELKQFLSQKRRFVEIFSQIFPDWKNRKWTFNQLVDAIDNCIYKQEPQNLATQNLEKSNDKDDKDFNSPTTIEIKNKKWQRTARIIGSDDFANLLLLKAKELKILVEEIPEDDEITEFYSLNLKQKAH